MSFTVFFNNSCSLTSLVYIYKDIFKNCIFEVCRFFKNKTIDWGSAQKQKMVNLPKTFVELQNKAKKWRYKRGGQSCGNNKIS